jgi:Domain of unknown function (DUF3846)
MRAIVKDVAAPAVVVDRDLSYDFMRDTVGGFIEYVPIGPEIDVVCNDQGAIEGLLQNAAGFVGKILIVATDERTGATRDMSDEEIRKGLAYLQRFQDVQHPGVACGFVSGAENIERVLADKAKRIVSVWDSL